MTTLMGRRRSIPSCARATPTRGAGRAARGQHRDPGHRRRHHQGGDGALPGALRESGGETRLVLQIHDELLFEGPPEEMEEATELVRREMCAAYQLDPPLEVDIGVGKDWLDAK